MVKICIFWMPCLLQHCQWHWYPQPKWNVIFYWAHGYTAWLLYSNKKPSQCNIPGDDIGSKLSKGHGGGSLAVPTNHAASRVLKNAYFQHLQTSPNSVSGIWLSIPMFYTSKKTSWCELLGGQRISRLVHIRPNQPIGENFARPWSTL